MKIKKIQVNKNTLIFISKCYKHESIVSRGVNLTNLDKSILHKSNSKTYRLQFLSVRKLLANISDNYKISYYSNGGPFIVGHDENISISHTLDYVCISLSHSSIGVDIERIDTNRIYKIRSKFINDKEELILKKKGKSYINIMWSVKEAIYKMMKTNLSSLKYNINIIKLDNGIGSALVLSDDEDIYVKLNYYFFGQHIISLANVNQGK